MTAKAGTQQVGRRARQLSPPPPPLNKGPSSLVEGILS